MRASVTQQMTELPQAPTRPPSTASHLGNERVNFHELLSLLFRMAALFLKRLTFQTIRIWVLSNFLFTPPPHHWSIPGEGGGAGWEEWRHATPWGHSWTRGGSQLNAPGDARAGAPGSTL